LGWRATRTVPLTASFPANPPPTGCERDLAARFAPAIYFDEAERWFPTDPRPYGSERDGETVVDGFDALQGYTDRFAGADGPPDPTVFYNEFLNRAARRAGPGRREALDQPAHPERREQVLHHAEHDQSQPCDHERDATRDEEALEGDHRDTPEHQHESEQASETEFVEHVPSPGGRGLNGPAPDRRVPW